MFMVCFLVMPISLFRTLNSWPILLSILSFSPAPKSIFSGMSKRQLLSVGVFLAGECVGFPVLAEKAERFGSYVGAIWLNNTLISVRLVDPIGREREREEA